MNWLLFFQTTFLFWVILDSVGSIPLYATQLKHFDAKRQRIIIIREMFIALAVMLFFFFFGENFFKLLNIKKSALQASGGVILFIISIRMIFSHSLEESRKTIIREPIIVPLAVPAIAGPGILATITLYSSGITISKIQVLMAILLSWILSLPILLLSSFLKQFLGQNGLLAIERLFGYIVVLIAAQTILNGIAFEFNLHIP